jgi:hypothetical protein
MLVTTQFAFADVTNDYQVIPGKVYRVLKVEILSGDGMKIHRLYDEYSGILGQVDYKGSMSYGRITKGLQYDIELPQSYNNLYAAKSWLQANNPERLQLLPYSIVSEEVQNEWSAAHYNPQGEYWELSPKGLVSYDIQTDYAIIPKPYLVEGLQVPNGPTIALYLDNTKIKFGADVPYIIDNSIRIPIKLVAQRLGYTSQYIADDRGIGHVILAKGPRRIEVSPWKDYISVSGVKVKFDTRAFLSINEKILVPLDLLHYMATAVSYDEPDEDKQSIRVDITK